MTPRGHSAAGRVSRAATSAVSVASEPPLWSVPQAEPGSPSSSISQRTALFSISAPPGAAGVTPTKGLVSAATKSPSAALGTLPPGTYPKKRPEPADRPRVRTRSAYSLRASPSGAGSAGSGNGAGGPAPSPCQAGPDALRARYSPENRASSSSQLVSSAGVASSFLDSGSSRASAWSRSSEVAVGRGMPRNPTTASMRLARSDHALHQRPIAHDKPRDVEPGGRLAAHGVAAIPGHLADGAGAHLPGADHTPGEIVEDELRTRDRQIRGHAPAEEHVPRAGIGLRPRKRERRVTGRLWRSAGRGGLDVRNLDRRAGLAGGERDVARCQWHERHGRVSLRIGRRRHDPLGLAVRGDDDARLGDAVLGDVHGDPAAADVHRRGRAEREVVGRAPRQAQLRIAEQLEGHLRPAIHAIERRELNERETRAAQRLAQGPHVVVDQQPEILVFVRTQG